MTDKPKKHNLASGRKFDTEEQVRAKYLKAKKRVKRMDADLAIQKAKANSEKRRADQAIKGRDAALADLAQVKKSIRTVLTETMDELIDIMEE